MKATSPTQTYRDTPLSAQLAPHLNQRAQMRRSVPLLPLSLSRLLQRLGAKRRERASGQQSPELRHSTHSA
ncbi:Uncharacterised protein [Bordetella ansorpii]|uniref:Uncharacterized protein n=1 Tax=Bordetella ansorpii TaxID=288768 RepID=A0A157QXW9_9BORD|nr:hypothetical protein [Bordetella ansorpii]SAI50528.1 Uncharacterised protein [Bordetella ansorpii]